jgi:GTPase SAR1 family protein
MEDLTNFAPKNVTTMLVGNKSDLSMERTTSYSEASTLALKYDVMYYEVSAKTGNNVAVVFENLTDQMIKKEEINNDSKKEKKKKGKIDRSHVSANRITIDNQTSTIQKKEKNCCN